MLHPPVSRASNGPAALAGCLLAVVRNARTAVDRLAAGAERERLLALLAEGEIAAQTAGAIAALDEGAAPDLGPAGAVDASEAVQRALARAGPTLRSLDARTRVRTVVRAIPLQAPVDGFVRALAIAVSCAAVAAGTRSRVAVDLSAGGRGVRVSVRAEGGGAGTAEVPLPFSPAASVATLLERQGGRVRTDGGKPPRLWLLERPLHHRGDGLVASAP